MDHLAKPLQGALIDPSCACRELLRETPFGGGKMLDRLAVVGQTLCEYRIARRSEPLLDELVEPMESGFRGNALTPHTIEILLAARVCLVGAIEHVTQEQLQSLGFKDPFKKAVDDDSV